MLQHVYERASRARRLSRVVVATDDRRILDRVSDFGGRAVMTSSEHVCGTDRVAEVAAGPEGADADVVVNVQGDQPLIDPIALDRLVAAFDEDADLRMATLFELLDAAGSPQDPNVAKVVTDRWGRALYFSRSPIPYHRHGSAEAVWHKHVGVYAFRKDFLFEFTRLPRGPLEQAEDLEQLRALEAGYRIRLVPCTGSSVSVETPDDLRKVETLMER